MCLNKIDSVPFNFFLHPFKMLEKHETLAILAILTHIGLTIITGGLW